jgi:hypothetical protein
MLRIQELAAVEQDTTNRAARSALWLALVEAQRSGWPDVIDGLLPLLQIADARIREHEISEQCQIAGRAA